MAAPQGFEPRLPESKSGVLPLDEEAIIMVPMTGIEPVTRGFSIRCSTD